MTSCKQDVHFGWMSRLFKKEIGEMNAEYIKDYTSWSFELLWFKIWRFTNLHWWLLAYLSVVFAESFIFSCWREVGLGREDQIKFTTFSVWFRDRTLELGRNLKVLASCDFYFSIMIVSKRLFVIIVIESGLISCCDFLYIAPFSTREVCETCCSLTVGCIPPVFYKQLRKRCPRRLQSWSHGLGFGFDVQ